jgi:hypothetical protein
MGEHGPFILPLFLSYPTPTADARPTRSSLAGAAGGTASNGRACEGEHNVVDVEENHL